MNYTKSDTNNAIVTTLTNVRKHTNADKLKLATVLGTQVVVGLDAEEGQKIVYFDSNLQLSYEYLSNNNLFSNAEMNKDTTKKGYFGKNGRVKAQKLRGELSNGYVATLDSFNFIERTAKEDGIFGIGDEFTHINGIEICKKFVIQISYSGGSGDGKRGKKTGPICDTFIKHWDTKQLMRELTSIPEDATLYIEEKIHGTSGRTGFLICKTNRKWYQIWKPRKEYKVISGTRRMDDIGGHIATVRKEVENKVAPLLHKGETLYYEIYGYDTTGKPIQYGFTYGCKPGEYRAMLYRVTITTPDGYTIDLDREAVYRRAEELGLDKPTLLSKIPAHWSNVTKVETASSYVHGKSALDLNTLREGVVVWFKSYYGSWMNLKHKSEEFLMVESNLKDNEVGDVEDSL